MKIEDVKVELENYLKQCDLICGITKTARRNNKSLSGNNPYGNRFHEAVVSLAASETKLVKILSTIGENGEMEQFSALSEVIKSPTAKSTAKATALKDITLAWRSNYIHRLEEMTADPIPATEQVLPMAVVENTRGYIERVLLQANGCYEHQWYDACSVMIRRLVETLIIEMYHAQGKDADIQGTDGNYLMLGRMVDKVLSDTTWSLGRETKEVLPLLKKLGDRAAHNRTFIAKQKDIDKVIPGLRVLVDEFLHRANLK
jgi:Domain of unknown function (DUF4145)